MGCPIRYRFHPTDEELVGYFLQQRARMGNQFHSNEISEYPEFYGQEEPWVVWDKNGGSSVDDGEPLFFFTKRKKLNPNGKRFDRKVGLGTWSRQFSREVVAADRDTGCRINGIRREFRYVGGCDPQQNNSWLMQEFELCPTDALVLCTLKKNPRKAAQTNGKKRKYPELYLDNGPLFSREELLAPSPLNVSDPLPHLESNESQSQDQSYVSTNDQFQDHSYEDNSFLSFLSTELVSYPLNFNNS